MHPLENSMENNIHFYLGVCGQSFSICGVIHITNLLKISEGLENEDARLLPNVLLLFTPLDFKYSEESV